MARRKSIPYSLVRRLLGDESNVQVIDRDAVDLIMKNTVEYLDETSTCAVKQVRDDGSPKIEKKHVKECIGGKPKWKPKERYLPWSSIRDNMKRNGAGVMARDAVDILIDKTEERIIDTGKCAVMEAGKENPFIHHGTGRECLSFEVNTARSFLIQRIFFL